MSSPIVVTCPSCGTGNRIPVDMEGRHGRCGTCHAALPPMYRTPQQLITATFDAFLAGYGAANRAIMQRKSDSPSTALGGMTCRPTSRGVR